MVWNDSEIPTQKATRPSHNSLTETFPEVGRRIRVYKNGDIYDSGINVVLNMRQIHNIGNFLDAISERIGLVLGAKKLYTLEGKLIKKTSELQNGHEYVASSGSFTKAPYGERSMNREYSFGTLSKSRKSMRSKSTDVLHEAKKKAEYKPIKTVKSNASANGIKLESRGVKRSKSSLPEIKKYTPIVGKVEKAISETPKKVKKDAEKTKEHFLKENKKVKDAATLNGTHKMTSSPVIVKPVKAGVRPAEKHLNKSAAEAGKAKEKKVKKETKAKKASAAAATETTAATAVKTSSSKTMEKSMTPVPSVKTPPLKLQDEVEEPKSREASPVKLPESKTPEAKKLDTPHRSAPIPLKSEHHESLEMEKSSETLEQRSKSESGNVTDYTEESGIGTAATEEELESSETEDESEKETDGEHKHSDEENSDDVTPPSQTSRRKSKESMKNDK